MKNCLVFLSTMSVFLLLAQNSYTCSCGPRYSIQEALKNNTAVFTAQVEKISTDRKTRWGDLKIKTKIIENFKGLPWQQNMVIRTAKDSAACGFNFEKNKKYLIYSYLSPEGKLQTNICTRTNNLANAHKEIALLRDLTNN